MIDLKKISSEVKKDIINPSVIFASLPNKAKKYGYLRQVQGEVLNQWFEQRNQKDIIIKMNTGSGKTTVSLLILQSCLNENKGNAIYVVPDNYLIKQVEEEARDLGIKVTTDINDIDYIKRKSILVITIQKLINGKSIFNTKNKIDNIVIDDVHACLDNAEQQFIVRIEKNKFPNMYKDIFELFKSELERQNHINSLNLKDGLQSANPMLVPYWEIRTKSKVLGEIINSYKENENYKTILFPFEFLNDILQYCNVCISHDCIEISPDCLPINKVTAFCEATRRIFISATLKDDGKLLKSFDIEPSSIKNVLTPENGLDIGNRMILFPQAINTDIKDIEIKQYLKQISVEKRIIVIVPSKRRSEFWNDVADRVFDKSNIEQIKNYSKGLDVLINRYDGIDLKDDLCSYLVIDGLPQAKSLYEQMKEILLRNTSQSMQDKIQKIEQGMGRGIRSNLDNCGVVIMGKNLLNIIYNNSSMDNFSASTKVQFELSEQVSEQLKGQPLEEIMKTFELCLERNEEWLSIMNESLCDISNPTIISYNEKEIELNKAFRYALAGNNVKAINIIQKIANEEKNEIIKSYYTFLLAKYKDFTDQVESQRILLNAKQLNRDIILPLDGYDYIPTKTQNVTQAENIVKIINDKYDGDCQRYLYALETINANLMFCENSHTTFENNINDLCHHLGFEGNMPEKETSEGPDNLWNLGNNKYLVIECKNETITEFISKKDCGQLENSINWGKEKYGAESDCIGIMIHKSKVMDHSAFPRETVRIITEIELENLKNNIIFFAKKLQTIQFDNVQATTQILNEYNLTANKIVKIYTTPYEKKD